jgi:hypothetical protein
LYPQSPEAGEFSEPPGKALAEGFEVSFADFGVLRVLIRISKGHRDETPFISPEGATVDAG